jgi:hypothetical protein
LNFADRDAVDAIVADAERSGGGVRSLLHATVRSPLFETR